MKNRLFHKIFLTTAISLIISTILIMILLSVSVNNYFVNDKKQLLTDNCLTISNVLSRRTDNNTNFYASLDGIISVVSNAVLGEAYVSDAQGNVFSCSCDEWAVEKVNLTRFSFTSETLKISFVKNPFYIGVAAVDQGIADDNYCITPCSRYVAAEIEYFENNHLAENEEIRVLKQFLHTVSVETGIALKLGQFFFFDYDYYDIDEDDGNRNISITYGREDLLFYTKAMDYFSKAVEIEDEEIKYLHFYKIIEYFSPVASKKNAYNMLNLRLDALRVKSRDQKYLESIFQLTRDYDTSLKDKELATTVLRECADSLELFDVLPQSTQQQIKKRLHLQKEILSLNPSEKEVIDKEIGQILYSTRNQIVHAKSNYRPTGYECNTDDMEQLNVFMKKLCQCLIIWNNRQPAEYRLD